MKSFFLVLFCGLSLVGSLAAQSLNDLKAPSSEHIIIKGTNIAIIPPEGFEPSPSFKGFQNPSDQTSMIMVMELPVPFALTTEGFKKEMMEPRGMELLSKKTVTVSGYEAFLIELTQEANAITFSKSILVYGDTSATFMINGAWLKDSTTLGAAIKQSILSTFVDMEVSVDPRKGLPYQIEETAGNMQFIGVVGNSIIFTRDGNTPPLTEDEAMFIIDRSFAEVDVPNKKLFCLNRLEKHKDDWSLNLEKEVTEIELDGLQGYQLFAKNNLDDSLEMIQTILFLENGGYYICVGTYKKAQQQVVEDITSILKTFKQK